MTKAKPEDFLKAIAGLEEVIDRTSMGLYELDQTSSHLTQYPNEYDFFYDDYQDIKALIRVTIKECLKLRNKVTERRIQL